jgi:hypothetical protein
MTDPETIARVLDAAEMRRAQRRRFLQTAGTGVVAAGGLALLSSCFGGSSDDDSTENEPSPTPSPTPTPTSTVERDALRVALNLEYLEAQFYAYAATGEGLPADQLTGAGTQGTVTGGRRVAFSDPVIAAQARELAADERAHVAFIRGLLGTAGVIAMPAINIDGGATGAFSLAARAAGLVDATSGTFDPYASDENFLLGAFLFEDVGVTAYKALIGSFYATDANVEATAGLLAAEAYHAGLIRTALYQKGLDTPSLRTDAAKISDARDVLDGSAVVDGKDTKDFDQGVTGSDANVANIVPSDANGIAFSRTVGQVLNITYLNKAQATSGGFFPAGLNGDIKTSAASG